MNKAKKKKHKKTAKKTLKTKINLENYFFKTLNEIHKIFISNSYQSSKSSFNQEMRCGPVFLDVMNDDRRIHILQYMGVMWE